MHSSNFGKSMSLARLVKWIVVLLVFLFLASSEVVLIAAFLISTLSCWYFVCVFFDVSDSTQYCFIIFIQLLCKHILSLFCQYNCSTVPLDYLVCLRVLTILPIYL